MYAKEECMDFVNLIILLALVEYSAFVMIVGATREKYGVPAPATTGHDDWERLYRIQVNTAEQLVLFIPSIYAFAYYVSELWAVGIGCVFLIGRITYFYGYRQSAEKRMPGAIMTTFPNYIMIIGSIIGLAMKLL
jgi:glutathione S-transferase